MALEKALEEALDFQAGCFLLSEKGGNLPVADSFATFTDQELGIGTCAFCRLLDDGVSGDLSLTVRTCNFSFPYWMGMLFPLVDKAA
jgi:hypothetical protein